LGRGSFEKDSPVEIGAMEKEQKTRLVHHHGLGKGQRHAHKTGESLAQGVIPALDMGGFSRLLPTAVCCSSGMTTARFPLDEKLPLALIEKLVQARVRKNDEAEKKK